MGGGSSRFEDTDWSTATGKLVSSEDTIDGAEPTQEYRTYTLHKRSVNQREYDVTDEDSNLLYSTRVIEGTLAWFDVLGPGMDDFKLRVQVDLSRRYWDIYRFGIPTYAGQFADMTATLRLREARGELQPCLYKKACITVSWSRYHAIVNPYGLPPEDDEDDSTELSSPDWLAPAASPQRSTSGPSLSAVDEEEKQPGLMEKMEDGAIQGTPEELEGKLTKRDASKSEPLEPPEADSTGMAATTTNDTNEDVELTDTKPAAKLAHGSNTEGKPSDPSGEASRPDTTSIDSSTSVSPTKGVEESKEEPISDDDKQSCLEIPNSKGDAIAAFNANSEFPDRSLLDDDLNDSAISEGISEIGFHARQNEEDDNVLSGFKVMDENGNLVEANSPDMKSSHIKKLKKWVKATSTKNFPPANPLEGYLLLDKPTLKCEEINSFMGQHQTMLIGKEEARELEKEELAQAAEMHIDAHNPNANFKEAESDPLLEGTASNEDQLATTRAFPRFRKLAKWINGSSSSSGSNSAHPVGSAKTESSAEFQSSTTDARPTESLPVGKAVYESSAVPVPREPEAAVEETKDDISDEGSTNQGGLTSSTVRNSSNSLASSNGESYPPILTASSSSELRKRELEPLVGFWNWDNTVRVHKMKLHVAEGSDLALHVVLAIVTNQLRLERNVVVSTV